MRFLLALAILIAGTYSAQFVEPPYHWLALPLSALGGFCVLSHRSRKVILRIGSLTWTEEELCRHFLITGDTGSGKTTSGFQPILIQLTRNIPNWGGLVLGVKGDEHRFVTELAKAHGRGDDLIHLEVRPPDCTTKWTPPHRYNLLSDRSIPWTTHAKAIVDIASSVTEGSKHAFFHTMAQIALANAFELLDHLSQPVTITRAYDLLTTQLVSERALRSLKNHSITPEIQRLIDFFESTFTKAKAHEQREAVEGTLKTYLGFFLNPDVAAVFSSDKPNTFNFSDLDRGSILSITMPQTLATERRYVQTYLKILFYFHVLRRFDISPSERNNKNLLLLIADEFQDLVTATEDGISDHKTVDRIRSAGACIIAGMQSEISADPAISEKKRKVLSLNMRSRLIFRAADMEGATLSADFIGKKRISKKTISSKTGSLTRTISRRQEQEH